MSNNYLSSVSRRTRCAGGKRVRLGICSPDSLPARLWADCPLQAKVTSPPPKWPLHSSLWFWVPVTTQIKVPVYSVSGESLLRGLQTATFFCPWPLKWMFLHTKFHPNNTNSINSKVYNVQSLTYHPIQIWVRLTLKQNSFPAMSL